MKGADMTKTINKETFDFLKRVSKADVHLSEVAKVTGFSTATISYIRRSKDLEEYKKLSKDPNYRNKKRSAIELQRKENIERLNTEKKEVEKKLIIKKISELDKNVSQLKSEYEQIKRMESMLIAISVFAFIVILAIVFQS